MRALTEYIKLVPKGISNLDKIIEGVTNQVKMELGLLPQEDEEVIVGRRIICHTCPYNSVNATKAGMYVAARTDTHCILCDCNIQTKTASLESNCGIETFNKQNPASPMNLKWASVK